MIHRVEIFSPGTPPATATLSAITPRDVDAKQPNGPIDVCRRMAVCPRDATWNNLPDRNHAAIKLRRGVMQPMARSGKVQKSELRSHAQAWAGGA